MFVIYLTIYTKELNKCKNQNQKIVNLDKNSNVLY